MSHEQCSLPRKKEDYLGTHVTYRDWEQSSAEARYKKEREEREKHTFLGLLAKMRSGICSCQLNILFETYRTSRY